MKRWIFALPLIALVGFGGLGLAQLFDGRKPSFERVSREAPSRVFEALEGEPIRFDTAATDAPILVNLWASWCTPCLAEHPILMSLSEEFEGRMYGVVFDDSAQNARAFLARHGNPFDRIAMDESGQGALDFGHTGVPETFVITPEGEIIYHLGGALTPGNLPALRAAMSGEISPSPGT